MLEDDTRIKALIGETPHIGIDILKYVDDSHILKRMALEVARAYWLPSSTVFMVGLGIFSSIVMRKYAACYRDGTKLPLGLYVVAEQASGAAKSPCINKFKEPFLSISADIKKRNKPIMTQLEAKLNDVGKGSKSELIEQVAEVKKVMEKHLFISNPTSEGLEKVLTNSGGYFSALGEEKGLLNSLLGGAYSGNGRSNNNDIVQNGFAGEMYVGARANRDAYAGRVVGSIVVFAQDGSFKMLFNQSDNSGLFERFLVLSEPSLVGKRDFNDFGMVNYDVYKEYVNKCNSFLSAIEENTDFDDLVCKKISLKAWGDINAMMNRLEPERCGKGKYASPTASSMANKLNMQVIKVAALLFLLGDADHYRDDFIPDEYIDMSIKICLDLFDYTISLLGEMDIAGRASDYSAICRTIEKEHNQWMSLQRIYDRLRNLVQFSHFKEKGNFRAYVRDMTDEMVMKDLLEIRLIDGKSEYKVK